MAKTKKASGRKAPALTNKLEGSVASIGETGSLITDISNDQVAQLLLDETVTIKFGPHETLGVFSTDHGQPDATMVACLGESGFLEIQIVGISLSEMLGIKAGTPVVVRW